LKERLTIILYVGLLKNFEKKLEQAIEGMFSKAFKSRVQPIEIAKKLGKAMDEGRTLGPQRTYAPNEYTVYLSTADLRELYSIREVMAEEMAEYLKERAKREGYTLVGPIKIEFYPREDLTRGQIETETKIVAKEGEVEETQAIELEEAESEGLAFAPACLYSFDEHNTFYLSKPVVNIGRADNNDIVLKNKSVSRSHAQIYRRGKRFYIRDLESTNGTYVNGKLVREKALKPGDIITLGEAKLEFRWIAD
jgi:hypothetical protein